MNLFGKQPLSISFAGLQLPNPTILASGIMGYSAESFERIAKGGAGAVVTKSVGVQPRAGYPNPTVVQAEAGLINAMGLAKPRHRRFYVRKSSFQKPSYVFP